MYNKNWNCVHLMQIEAHVCMFYTGQASHLMVSIISTDELTAGVKSWYTTGLFTKVLQTQFFRHNWVVYNFLGFFLIPSLFFLYFLRLYRLEPLCWEVCFSTGAWLLLPDHQSLHRIIVTLGNKSSLAANDIVKKNCSSVIRLAITETSGKFKWAITERQFETCRKSV